MDIYYVILLGFAVSMDGFFAGIAYGIKKISIPTVSLAAIGIATLFYTAIAAYGASALASSFDARSMATAGSLLLIGIGVYSILKQRFPCGKTDAEHKPMLCASLPTDNIVFTIMDKPEQADIDHSNHLNLIEALLLGTALGIDNMVATFAAGLAEPLPLYTPLAMCAIQTILVYGGMMIAKKFIAARYKKKLIYLPGIMLIFIGLFKMI